MLKLNMFKIPENVVENFIKSEFNWKPTSSKELRICSIYVQDSKFKCYIDPENFVFCDFKSGNSGSCYWLFADHLGVNDNKDVLVYLMRNYSFGEDKLLWETNNNKIIQPDVNNAMSEFITSNHPIWFKEKEKIDDYGKVCLKYLMDRKIDVEYIRNMGYVNNQNSLFNNRIIIPYIENGNMVYFQARAINKKAKLRYLNPGGLDTKSFVFNYDKLNNDELIICEGPFDAMSFDEQTATCLCSGDLSEKQIKKILSKSKPKDVIFVIDQDETGNKKRDKNIQKFITYCDYSPNIYIYNPTDGCKDMNELKVKTGKNYILKKECEKYGDFKWRKFSFEE